MDSQGAACLQSEEFQDEELSFSLLFMSTECVCVPVIIKGISKPLGKPANPISMKKDIAAFQNPMVLKNKLIVLGSDYDLFAKTRPDMT